MSDNPPSAEDESIPRSVETSADPADLTLTVGVEIEGLGDIDGETYTLSQDATDRITAEIEADVRDRHTHLDEDTELKIMAVTAPNLVHVVTREGDDE